MSAHFETIPIFDMQKLNQQNKIGDPYINRLLDACHHVGFFYIKNHGIDSHIIEQMFRLTRDFFNLPQHEKEAVHIAKSPHYRGYGCLGAETTLGMPDYKESYDLGLEQPPRMNSQEPYYILQGPNQWPDSNHLDATQWRKTVLMFLDLMLKLGKQLMSALSLALKVPSDTFINNFCANEQDSFAMLRLLRYPGQNTKQGNESEFGVGPHTDLGCLSILLQDEVGGLQVQNCNGQWIDAPPIKDTFVVNLGEMLQRWSNNYFLATPHRVINHSKQTRYSIPFFFEPNLSAHVCPLPINPDLLSGISRSPVSTNNQLIYGEHMLQVYQRSFNNL